MCSEYRTDLLRLLNNNPQNFGSEVKRRYSTIDIINYLLRIRPRTDEIIKQR